MVWCKCLQFPQPYSKILHHNNVGYYQTSNKNARRPNEAHFAQNLKEIKILDRAGEDLKYLDQ